MCPTVTSRVPSDIVTVSARPVSVFELGYSEALKSGIVAGDVKAGSGDTWIVHWPE
jgi:hypothetical protein